MTLFKKRLLRHGLTLSLILHLLVFSSTFVLIFQPETKNQHPKNPELYVPSYVYKGALTPMNTQKMAAPEKSAMKPLAREETPTTPSNNANKSISEETPITPSNHANKSIVDMSRETLKQQSINTMMQNRGDIEPMLLIGDQSKIADPFVKLIGRSLSAHFNYPEMAAKLGMTGKVLLSLTLNLDGTFSNIQIVRSSNNHDLDSAALYAVNTAPRVNGVKQFLSEPKHFIVGYIFN